MNNFFSCMRSKLTRNGKTLNKDNAPISPNNNPELKDDNCGFLIVKLVKSKHDKGLGLTVTGGIDRGTRHPVVSHLRLGGIADRSESLVIGDSILAVNKKKTENLTHQEVVDLLRNVGQHVHLRVQYRIPIPESTINTSGKTAVIQLKKEIDGFGIVARESPQISFHGYRQLVVASIRPGSAAQRRGVIHVGDRLLAINGQALLGLSRDDAVLLLKHAHNQATLQIEYVVVHKEPVSTGHGSWIIEVEKPASNVSLGLTLEDRSGVIVISDINEGGVADRLGVFHKEDQIVSINGIFVKDFSLAQVVEILGKCGCRIKLEFLSVHVPKNVADTGMTDSARFPNVEKWDCCQVEYTDDQLSLSTAHDEAHDEVPPTEHEATTMNGSSNRLQQHRELPETPSVISAGYDNTSEPFTAEDISPYEEISKVISQNREQVELNKAPGTKCDPVEGLYAKVIKPRSNSIGPSITSTGRNSPWSGQRTLSRRSSFSNSESNCGRRQFVSRRNGFWSSGSLKSVTNNHMCRLEHVEVNLTADSQGFGVTIAERCVGRNSVLVIAEIECGGPAERSGVLQMNDEILGINDTDVGMMTAEQCNGILQSFGTHANILVGFTVAESIVATSGTFSVKLAKHYFGLGITFTDITRNSDGETCIRISHVRKGSMAYRTGMLHLGDKLVALNGRKMACVEEAIALIDAIPMGEIVSVTVHKEEEVEDETAGVVYSVELSKQGQNSVGIVVADAGQTRKYTVVASLVPGSVAERSGAVHANDRILAINDVLVKDKCLKDVYHMMDYSGDMVKLRLQSVDSAHAQKLPGSLEIPDMTALHRVSAWAEIFSELDQIVSSSRSSGGASHKGLGNEGEAVKDDGSCVEGNCVEGNCVEGSCVEGSCVEGSFGENSESRITASASSEVKSDREDFWGNFDALWEGHMGSTGSEKSSHDHAMDCEQNLEKTNESNDCLQSPSEENESRRDCAEDTSQKTENGNMNAKHGGQDSTSGTIKGKSISVRYVVHEKCLKPLETENPTRENSLERSPSVASGYETDCSTIRSSINDMPSGGRMSSTDTEPFASVDSFDISNDAEDKIVLSAIDKTSQREIFETRSFAVRKSDEHGFGFILMPDKFKQEVYIASILPGGPCDGMLQPLDKITKIDDRDLMQLNIYEIIQILHHGPSTIHVSIVRNPFNTLIEECSS